MPKQCTWLRAYLGCMARQRQYTVVFPMNTAEAKPALLWVRVKQNQLGY